MKFHGEYSHDNPCIVTLSPKGLITVNGTPCDSIKVGSLRVITQKDTVAGSSYGLELLCGQLVDSGHDAILSDPCPCCGAGRVLQLRITCGATVIARHNECVILY